MTEQEIPYKIYEFYRNNPEETEREAYLYELYGDVKREAYIKDGILIAESDSSGFISFGVRNFHEGGVLVLGRGFFGNWETD